MTDLHAQATYQVRLGWGAAGLSTLAESGIVVIVDAIDTGISTGSAARSEALAQIANDLPHSPTVFLASLRNRAATAQAILEEQVARGGRTSINLVLVGDDQVEGGFAVDDYLAAGAIADSLTALGIDHSAPDVAVATEGFRALTRALKHLLSASAAGQALKAAGRAGDAKIAAELDAESTAIRFTQ